VAPTQQNVEEPQIIWQSEALGATGEAPRPARFAPEEIFTIYNSLSIEDELVSSAQSWLILSRPKPVGFPSTSRRCAAVHARSHSAPEHSFTPAALDDELVGSSEVTRHF
jgi:hypothetical protein